MKPHSSILVTKPDLPDLQECLPYFERIWESKVLTNNGAFHKELEEKLALYLGVPYLSLFCNATIALLTAIKALDLKGEVITTPYSFVATSHALAWNNIEPVFVDIDPLTLNLDPSRLEQAITPRTTGILPVHVYGQPCDVDAIQEIATKHNLKVIYDAAHAFGVRCHCGSVLNHGDLSVLSFHATKVFNTFEGGAIVSPSAKTKQRIDQLKNFGFVDEITVVETGINGKMSEFNAALGLAQLKHFEINLASRARISQDYVRGLKGLRGIKCLASQTGAKTNNSYFPILVTEDYPLSRDSLYEKLRSENIFARRYFYPLISEFSMYQLLPSAQATNLPNATQLSQQILCLPIYSGLSDKEQRYIIDVIREQ
jgi:dTDP-4-amino-4,6-dideoxygalactose transaminase